MEWHAGSGRTSTLCTRALAQTSLASGRLVVHASVLNYAVWRALVVVSDRRERRELEREDRVVEGDGKAKEEESMLIQGAVQVQFPTTAGTLLAEEQVQFPTAPSCVATPSLVILQFNVRMGRV